MEKLGKPEKGQILVLVAVGMAALIGMTALAIDGGNAYSDRRHAQNAADTSAMAAGLAFVDNGGNWPAAQAAGLTRASDNGFDGTGSNSVQVLQCNDPQATCDLPSPLPPLPGGSPDLTSYYIQTKITSHVPTYLARVIGIAEVTNEVEAIVHSVPQEIGSRNEGQALVSLMPGCKPPDGSWPYDPFTMGGTADVIVNHAGVFVNSTCDNAFTSQNNTTLQTPDGGTCVVGGTIVGGYVAPPPQDHCGSQVDLQQYSNVPVDLTSCPNPGAISTVSGHYEASPGYYNQSFPNVSPAGTLYLHPGIYCMKNGINVGAGWTIMTDLDGNGVSDGSDGANEGVMFYVPTGEVTFNGGSSIHIGAMNNINVDIGIRGYLIYLPPTNDSPVKIAGNNGSTFIGTILAPASLVTLEGGSDTDSLNLQCQIIGYSIRTTGNGTLNITYDGGKIGKAWNNPVLEPYK